jgi:hypothetical protein
MLFERSQDNITAITNIKTDFPKLLQRTTSIESREE